VINLNTSQHVIAEVTTRYNDGANFSMAHICCRNENIISGGVSIPYRTSQTPSMGRTAAVIAGKYVFVAEDFGIMAIENY
jgi:hypothetical protein